MKRSLLALAVAGAAAFSALPAQAAITPGCDDPVDVACNQAYSPDNPSTPVICLLWVNHRCVVR